MERVYYKRDRRVVVEEVPDVKAVRLGADHSGVTAADAESFGTSAADTVRSSVTSDLPESEDPVAAFERANWTFVTPSEDVTRAFSAGESVPDAEEVGKVIVGRSGTVAIATNRLNVQLKPDLSEDESEAILSEKNLEVLSKLNFAPNLYEVVARGRDDALDASVELHEDERFTLAEPAFIEHIGQRFTPNDPRFAEQWQWNNTGQNGGTAGADVSAEQAWESTLGAGVRVAVIDNGFDKDHEDLAAGVSPESGFFRKV